MECPYKKPAYLNELESKNCYATNRGWVILKPQGKYDVIESIMGLDDKIKIWEKDNKVDTPVNDIPVEFARSVKKLNKTILEEELEHLHLQIKLVDEKIEEIEKTLPVLDKVIKPAKKVVVADKTEEKIEVTEDKVVVEDKKEEKDAE